MKKRQQINFGNEISVLSPSLDGDLGDFLGEIPELEKSLGDAELDGLLRELGDFDWGVMEPFTGEVTALPAVEGEVNEAWSTVSNAIRDILKVIPAKLDAFRQLLQSKGYPALQQIISLKDMLNIVRQPGGSANLKALLNFQESCQEGLSQWLESNGITSAQLVQVLAQPGGYINLTCLPRLCVQPENPIFSILAKEEMLGLLSQPMGFQSVVWLERLDRNIWDSLIANGFEATHLCNLLHMPSGHEKLDLLIKINTELKNHETSWACFQAIGIRAIELIDFIRENKKQAIEALRNNVVSHWAELQILGSAGIRLQDVSELLKSVDFTWESLLAITQSIPGTANSPLSLCQNALCFTAADIKKLFGRLKFNLTEVNWVDFSRLVATLSRLESEALKKLMLVQGKWSSATIDKLNLALYIFDSSDAELDKITIFNNIKLIDSKKACKELRDGSLDIAKKKLNDGLPAKRKTPPDDMDSHSRKSGPTRKRKPTVSAKELACQAGDTGNYAELLSQPIVVVSAVTEIDEPGLDLDIDALLQSGDANWNFSVGPKKQASLSLADIEAFKQYPEITPALIKALMPHPAKLNCFKSLVTSGGYGVLKAKNISLKNVLDILKAEGGACAIKSLRGLLGLDNIQTKVTLDILQQHGFTASCIANILANNGGSRNLAALVGLLSPALNANQEPIMDERGQPITQLALLNQLGFDAKAIVGVLANGGGSHNLAALVGLLSPALNANQEPIMDGRGQPITQLALLNQFEFDAKTIVRVLANNGGSRNLAALVGLLSPALNANQEPIMDGRGQPITQLALLNQFEFDAKTIVRVLANDGGSRNLATLVGLLSPALNANQEPIIDERGQPITQLALLNQLGFDAKAIAGVLANIGGSHNLAALVGLLSPALNANQEPIMDKRGQPITQLALLNQLGFDAKAIVGVLANIGGSHNLAALIGLLHLVLDTNQEPIMDERGQPITQLAFLNRFGFDAKAIVGVLANDGGSHNLAALIGLLHLVLDTNQEPIMDERGQPITQLALLNQLGFDAKAIVGVLANGGGSHNLAALVGLLSPALNANQEPIMDGRGQPITQLALLNRFGFDAKAIEGVLANGGGSHNLAALVGLLSPALNANQEPIMDGRGQPITQLALLNRFGFDAKAIKGVLANNGGSRNLAALVGLLSPALNANQEPIIDERGQPITQLALLNQLGFDAKAIAGVLANIGGSHNLAALVGLLSPALNANQEPIMDERGQPITQLALLNQFEFDAKAIVGVLANNGGSRNLAALVGLLSPALNANQEPIMDERGQPITQLALLNQFEFDAKAIVGVLANRGGSHNLAALVQLYKTPIHLVILHQLALQPEEIIKILQNSGGKKTLDALFKLLSNPSVLSFFVNESAAREAILSIAYKASKSEHILFLNNLLERDNLRAVLIKENNFPLFVSQLTTLNTKRLSELRFGDETSLEQFISRTERSKKEEICPPMLLQDPSLLKRGDRDSQNPYAFFLPAMTGPSSLNVAPSPAVPSSKKN